MPANYSITNVLSPKYYNDFFEVSNNLIKQSTIINNKLRLVQSHQLKSADMPMYFLLIHLR